MGIINNFISSFKSMFEHNSEDILLAYRREIGILDAQGIEKYLKKHDLEKVIVFTEVEINQNVRSYFSNLENIRLIKCKNMKKEIKKWEKKFSEKEIRKVSLDDFGTRPIQRDVD